MTVPPFPQPAAAPPAKKRSKWGPFLGVVLVIGVANACVGGDDEPRPVSEAIKDAPATSSSPAAPSKAVSEAPASSSAPAPKPKPKPAAPPAPPEPEVSVAQEQALEQAQQYIDLMPFSEAGLLEQLTSEYGSQFAQADAAYAVANVSADWNAEAVEAAEAYLEVSSFSRAGLIDQLTSEYGSQFTPAQAEHAANAVGL